MHLFVRYLLVFLLLAVSITVVGQSIDKRNFLDKWKASVKSTLSSDDLAEFEKFGFRTFFNDLEPLNFEKMVRYLSSCDSNLSDSFFILFRTTSGEVACWDMFIISGMKNQDFCVVRLNCNRGFVIDMMQMDRRDFLYIKSNSKSASLATNAVVISEVLGDTINSRFIKIDYDVDEILERTFKHLW
ncbi:MAG: hypothetical protein JNM41_02170 [Flavipsychrobacter sp.]|nr:hypothetical protein [Flavipsychrobacter sp.]